MKKTFYLFLLTLIVISCKKEVNYATFSGKIINKNSDSLVISDPNKSFNQSIKINEDGTFSDNLMIENGLYTISDGTEYSLIYLEKGDELNVNLDAKNFLNTINFTGNHANENNFIANSVINEEELLSDVNLMDLPKSNFDIKIKNYVDRFNENLSKETLTPEFVASQKLEIEDLKNYYTEQYIEKHYITLKLGKGVNSPKFVDYENYAGGNTSLDDLKGKYVYIDLWATWCPPCKAEIPHLEKVEKEFHGKNIAFVSISLDVLKARETWRKMVTDKELTGIQLYAKGSKDFTDSYRVKSIPRFILIDTEGKIINANAPRPSQPELTELLKTLNI